jgi:hypothetical protein
MFPYLKGFLAESKRMKMLEKVRFLAVLGPIVFAEMLGQQA